jgi:Mg2+ and Co2+ transporter CorA
VDVVGNPDEIDAWKHGVLKRVGASELVRRAAFSQSETASVVSTGRAVYMRFPVMVGSQDDPIVYINGLILVNLLVTWRTDPTDGVDSLLEGLTAPSDLPWVTSVSDLVAALASALTAELFDASQDLRQRIDAITDDADHGKGVDGNALDAVNRRLHVIDEVSGDYSQVFPMLRDTNSKALDFSGHHTRIQVAISSAHALSRRVKLYYTRVSQLRDQQDRDADDKMNRRLGVLSVLSAIFLPLTLLTGIFGMNFRFMPSLEHPWAYPALLILMVVIAAGLWRYFKKNEWI